MLMTRSHDAVTQSQFGPRAALYVTSALHAAGPDLDALEAIAAETRPGRALDLGCGTMVAAIHALQAAASDEVRAYFAIEPDGSFLLDVVMLEATA